MDKRRSERSEKRRQRLSVRSSLSSTQRASFSSTRTEASVAMVDMTGGVVDTTTVSRSRKGISLEKMEEGTSRKAEEETAPFSSVKSQSSEIVSLPGAFRVSSIIEPNMDDCTVAVEESSTGSMSGSDSPQVVLVPSASLVEEKAQTEEVEKAVPIAYAQDGMFMNKRLVRCFICVSCLIFIALGVGLLLALMKRGPEELVPATSENAYPYSTSAVPTSVPTSDNTADMVNSGVGDFNGIPGVDDIGDNEPGSDNSGGQAPGDTEDVDADDSGSANTGQTGDNEADANDSGSDNSGQSSTSVPGNVTDDSGSANTGQTGGNDADANDSGSDNTGQSSTSVPGNGTDDSGSANTSQTGDIEADANDSGSDNTGQSSTSVPGNSEQVGDEPGSDESAGDGSDNGSQTNDSPGNSGQNGNGNNGNGNGNNNGN